MEQMSDVLHALYEYKIKPQKDLYANLVLNLVPSNSTIILTLIYLKPVDSPEAYAPFYELTPMVEQGGLMTLRQLQGLFPTHPLPRWAWYTVTFKPNSKLYEQISLLLSSSPEVAAISALQGGTIVGTAQPINSNVVRAGHSRGGNALGLQPIDQTWFALNAAWWKAEDDPIAYEAVEALHAKIEVLAKNSNLGLPYIFMNDANIKQSVISSYGSDNLRRLRATQKVYDPQRVFQKLVTGGQKIPAR